MRKIIKIVTAAIVVLMLNSCGSASAIADIQTNCGIEDLKSLNSISEECKDAIQSLLPSDDNNLLENRLALGKKEGLDSTLLFVMGTDSSGSAIDLTTKAITIEAKENGVKSVLTTADYQIRTLSDYSNSFDTPLLSLSSVVDYSSSMSDSDIDDAVSIFSDIFKLFVTPLLESEIRLFSETVWQKLDFNSDSDVLVASIARDASFTRNSTALYDGMGTGLAALATRDAPIRIMIVATDGQENASMTYKDKSQLYKLAQDNKIPVIMMGTLLSDIGFMREVASETNGFFIYTKTLLALKQQAILLTNMIKNIQVIEVTKNFASGTTYAVTIDGKVVNF